MNTEIIIENLSKNFNNVQALKNISLHIEKGMFGLIGRNGAGKTTLIRIITTLLNKSGGNVTVCGIPVEKPKEIRKVIGYLPQDFSIYPNMRVYESMDYLGVLSGLNKSVRKDRIKALLHEVNLSDSRKLKVKALSGGMKRRLGIAQALLHDPQVLIVDEPTAGLDPEERVRFRNLLRNIAGDRIVLLSTHIVEDIEKTCEKIVVLDNGELIYSGTLTDFVGEEKSLEKAYIKKMKEVE
jgi:ABC-2 type transport system ATP-binding protein